MLLPATFCWQCTREKVAIVLESVSEGSYVYSEVKIVLDAQITSILSRERFALVQV
mgnify:CR=1 FL=1